MCAQKKTSNRKNNDRRRNNDKSIESIDYYDGVVFVSISVCRLLHFGHVAHIAIALFIYWNGQTSKEYSLRTKWRTVLIIWLGWFYTFFSLSLLFMFCAHFIKILPSICTHDAYGAVLVVTILWSLQWKIKFR